MLVNRQRFHPQIACQFLNRKDAFFSEHNSPSFRVFRAKWIVYHLLVFVNVFLSEISDFQHLVLIIFNSTIYSAFTSEIRRVYVFGIAKPTAG